MKTAAAKPVAKPANVSGLRVDLTPTFEQFAATVDVNEADFPAKQLALANARSRLRMVTLYYYGQINGLLVTGTGNKVEDFGVGFFTKYGDGGVDISPIAGLLKTQRVGSIRPVWRHIICMQTNKPARFYTNPKK